MIPIEVAVSGAKRIEALLERRFGATGRGLHEKLTSVQSQVPPAFCRSIRWVATIRNKVVHEEGTVGSSAAEFRRTVDAVVDGLEPETKPRPKTVRPRTAAAGKAPSRAGKSKPGASPEKRRRLAPARRKPSKRKRKPARPRLAVWLAIALGLALGGAWLTDWF